MGRTRIKICGVRDEASALAAAEAGADALGFVFAQGSPRAVDPDTAYEVACFLPPFVTRVALFVDPSLRHVMDVGEAFPFDAVQLHGSETEARAREVRRAGAQIVKAITFDPETIDEEIERWGRVDEVDALLVDGSAGGMGVAFDWGAFAGVAAESVQPLILAGGLTPENVGDAIRAVRPFAVDVSSGVERERGVKDPAMIGAFCEAVRAADADLA